MLVCIEKSTGRLLESQSIADENVLLQNAINAGFTPEEVEIKAVTEEEYLAILDAQPKPEQQKSAEQRIAELEQLVADMAELLLEKGVI